MPDNRTSSVSQAPPATTIAPGRSLFPQVPTFSLETFSSRDFVVKDFVEALSNNAIPQHRRSAPAQQSEAFDPKPLIRSFEHALKRISDLSGDLELRENELSAAARRAEAQHQGVVQNLSRKLDHTVESFHRLDASLSGGDLDFNDKNVTKIGEKLETLDRQRTRAQDAKFIIQCWMELSERGELILLEDIKRQGDGNGNVRCARIARILTKISQRLDPDHWPIESGKPAMTNGINGHHEPAKERRRPRHNTRELIEKFAESLEQDLLKSFDRFYRKRNFQGMIECAGVLRDFNGGASVIGAFVNQHEFFIDRSQLVTEDVGGDPALWERLADPDSEPPGIEASLQTLIEDTKAVVIEESGLIKRAFPYAEEVLIKFIQRIFQQSIQQRLEMVLEKANTVSSLAFLRALQTARNSISNLVDELKAHGLTEHPETVSPQMAIVLDQQFDDLFVPYLAGNSYIEREKRSLEELYSSLLFKFTIFHSRRRKVPTTFIKSLAKSGSELLASARDAYVERLDSSDLAPAQKSMLLRVAGLKESTSAKDQTEIEVMEEDGILRADNAKRMLKWLAEAVGRDLELSSGSETAKDMSTLLHLLLNNMGYIYLETALEAAYETATAQESTKNEPDLSYLLNLRPAIVNIHLLATCIQTVLVPLASTNLPTSRNMEKSAASLLGRVEDRLNSILQKTIDVVIAWTSRLLSRQQKTDFRPRDDALSGTAGDSSAWLEQLQTPTCLATFIFLVKIHNLALPALTPSPNLTHFLTEMGSAVRSLLLTHFTKFNVNAAGGIMVTKDISKYVELLRSWETEDGFRESLEVLAEIGHLFVIGSEALGERLRGMMRGNVTGGGRGAGGAPGLGWDVADLKAYVLRREDVGSVGVQSVLGSLQA